MEPIPGVFDEARLVLGRAAAAARAGDEVAARALLRAAGEAAAEGLEAMGERLLGGPEWRRFEAACRLEATISTRERFWRREPMPLPVGLRTARHSLDALAAQVAGARGDAGRSAELGGALEDLLDQVWRCEREWELDTRLRLLG